MRNTILFVLILVAFIAAMSLQAVPAGADSGQAVVDSSNSTTDDSGGWVGNIVKIIFSGGGGLVIGWLLSHIKNKEKFRHTTLVVGEGLDIPAIVLKAISDGKITEDEREAILKEIAEAKAAALDGNIQTAQVKIGNSKHKARHA